MNINSNTKSRSRPRGLLLLSVLIFGGIALALVAHFRLQINDAVKLYDYHPSVALTQLANQDTMTGYASHIFYVNHPEILSSTKFVLKCPNNGGEQTIVLGCYHGGQNGIFLLSVSDPKLDGVEQVTAAHEMLHAAYDRLSPTQKRTVDGLLLDYYNHVLKDPRILDTIAAYKKTEPKDVVNEMHSVFGTEVSVLPPALENYYKRYFINRSKVTGYAAQYEAVFTSRQQTLQQDDAMLDSIKSQIDDLESQLKSQLQVINAKQVSLSSLKQSGDFDAYNAAVPGYNQLVDSYNASVTSVRNLVSQYNQLVDSRNAVALEEDQLIKELSTPTGTIGH